MKLIRESTFRSAVLCYVGIPKSSKQIGHWPSMLVSEIFFSRLSPNCNKFRLELKFNFWNSTSLCICTLNDYHVYHRAQSFSNPVTGDRREIWDCHQSWSSGEATSFAGVVQKVIEYPQRKTAMSVKPAILGEDHNELVLFYHAQSFYCQKVDQWI